MKKVNGMPRTKGQIRGSKSKGNQFEYNVQASLKQIMPDMQLTKHLGFKNEFDLASMDKSVVIECKCHKGFSWNELKKTYLKLEERGKEFKTKYLVVKGNQQPVLVCGDGPCGFSVAEFEGFFGIPFIKHEPTRAIKDGRLSEQPK